MSDLPIVGADPRWLRERQRAEQALLRRSRARQVLLLGLAALALLGLGWRVVYWQIQRQAQLVALADAEHLRELPVPAGRGVITDANGIVLAVSVTADALIADPEVIRSENALDQVVATLARLTALPVDQLRRQLDVPGQYVELRGRTGQTLLLPPEVSDQIRAAIGRGELPGVAVIPRVRRVYPSGPLAAQVLGFVRASDGAGQYGIEQQLNALLAGRPGTLYAAVDAAGHPLATGLRRLTPATPGATVTLTLDANIQYWAEQGLAATVKQMRATGGTVIVLDAKTGAVLAMANAPSFDPNAYAQAGLSRLSNPAVSALYDPGSVMKAMTMAAGIDAGVITPETTFYDAGYTYVDGVPIYNFDRTGHGEETMTEVLRYSANVGAIWVAQRVGRERFEQYLAAFGYGSATNVGLPGEAAGLLPQASSPGEAELNMAENSFGESIGVTPLQVAAAYGALANGGVLLRPYIVASVTGPDGRETRYGPRPVRRVISAGAARTVTRMLVDSSRWSEAEMYRMDGYSVAAKTGTSTPDPSNPYRTYASVAGYAPASDPRFVLLVTLDAPQVSIFGGEAAGPLWRSLAERLFAYEGIPPDLPQAG